jgi:hypothetical protein
VEGKGDMWKGRESECHHHSCVVVPGPHLLLSRISVALSHIVVGACSHHVGDCMLSGVLVALFCHVVVVVVHLVMHVGACKWWWWGLVNV